MILTLKIANQSFLHDPPSWWVEDNILISIDILTLPCDLDCSNPIFSLDTLPYDDVLSDQAWLLKIQQFRRYIRKHCILIIWALTVTLILETANIFFVHDSLAHDDASPYQVWYQTVLWFWRYHQDKHSLTFWILAVTLTLNTVIRFFHRTLWLVMLYYSPKSGWKWTCSLEDIVQIVAFCLY